MSHFGSYIQDILDKNDGISYGDVQRFLNGEDILEAEFPKLLRPKGDGTQSIRPDRTTTEVNDAFGRLELDSNNENKAEKKRKKTRRSQNAQRKQDWFDRGGRGGGGRGGGAAGGSTART
jgi:hypothetical protein